MAAPPSASMANLTGNWSMNKRLSDSPDAGLALQGISYLTRKAITFATVSLATRQYMGEPLPVPPEEAGGDEATAGGAECVHIDLVQTAAGLSSSREHRCVDRRWRHHADWLFGRVRGYSRWLDEDGALPEIPDADEAQLRFLVHDGQRSADQGQPRLVSYVEGNGWTALQVWGFEEVEAKRMHTRRVLVSKGDQHAVLRLVYEYTGEMEPQDGKDEEFSAEF